MKRSIVLLSMIVYGFSQNLLQNPGFESWTGSIPDYWVHDTGLCVFKEYTIIHGGHYSVRDSCKTQTQADADFQQGRFPVSSLTNYVFTIWVIDNDPAGRIRQGIYWYPSGSDWSSVYTADSALWQELTLEVMSPIDAESATVVVRAYDVDTSWNGDAVFYIDDASIIAPAQQPPVILRVWHTPIHPAPGTPVDAYGWARDNGTIVADTLFYGINNLGSPAAITHTAVYSDTFRYVIPGYSTGDTIFYYQKYIDDDGLEALSDTIGYYVGVLDVYINELFYDSYQTDSACYVELYRNGGGNLDGFALAGVSGSSGNKYVTIDLTGCTIPNDGYFVVASDSTVAHCDLVTVGADFHNGPDNVELRFHNITIDALGYGPLTGWYFTGEWIPAPDVGYDHCLGRYPDGLDTDNNFEDFNDYTTLSPGQPNPAVGIDQLEEFGQPAPIVMNPVRSDCRYVSLIADRTLYPLTVYSVTGQYIRHVASPENLVSLPSGVYFVRTNALSIRPAKYVVVE